MQIKQTFLLIIFFVIVGNYSYANEVDYRMLGTKDGFSNLTCYSIFKDSRGFLWFGMNNGLNRFDGVRVKTYSGFEDSQIFSICEKDNYLWVGSSNKLKRMNLITQKEDEIFSIDNKSSLKGVRDIHIGTDNILYIASERGLYIYKEQKLEHHIFDSNILSPANFILSILEEKKDSYWLVTRKGLVHYNPVTKSSELFSLNNLSQSAKLGNSIIYKDCIYIGLYPQGLLTFNCKTKHTSMLKNFENIDISKLIRAGSVIFAATGKGLKAISTTTNEEISIDQELKVPEIIKKNNISSFFIENDRCWINVFESGIYCIQKRESPFIAYEYPQLGYSTKGVTIRSFYIGDNGEKLIGTKDQGLHYISEKGKLVKKISTKTEAGLPSDLILFIKPYKNNYLVGTYNGLRLFNPKNLSFSIFKNDSFLSDSRAFYYCVEDNNHNLWFATDKGLIYYDEIKGTVVQYFETTTGSSIGDITMIFCDSKNRLWIGTSQGLYIMDIATGTLRNNIFPQYNSLKDEIKYFFEDSKRNVWICTQRDGLIKVNEEISDVKIYSTNDILPNNVVYSVVEDKAENLWFSTLKGILRYNINNESYRLFGFSDGVFNSFFYNRVQYDTINNTIWWANGDGLIKASLNNIEDNLFSIPKVVSVSISGEKVDLIKEQDGEKVTPEFIESLSLANGENTIRLTLSLLNFSFSKGSYEYMLTGYDKGWQKSIENDEIEYSNLSAGSYLLKIREFGKPESERSLKIRVSETFFSYIAIFLCIILIVFIAFILYWKKIKITKNQMPAVESEIHQEVVLENKPKYKFSKTDNERLEKIYNELIEYIKVNKPYTNPDLKLSDLASEINYPPYELSKMFSLYLNKNYYDFINEFRINLFKELVDSGEYKNYTLMSIAEQCGFKSKSSFYGAFKKIMNTTPNEYIKR